MFLAQYLKEEEQLAPGLTGLGQTVFEAVVKGLW